MCSITSFMWDFSALTGSDPDRTAGGGGEGWEGGARGGGRGDDGGGGEECGDYNEMH